MLRRVTDKFIFIKKRLSNLKTKESSFETQNKQLKSFVLILLLSVNLNAQLDSLSLPEFEQKIKLDTKVKLSKNYFNVSALVLVGGVLLRNINDDLLIFGSNGNVAASGTTAYYLAKHLLYVRKRNRFYKKHRLSLKTSKKKKKALQ
jgi:hypothetical protein